MNDMRKTGNIMGKVALVTGATGQLGEVFCEALANNGATVWVSGLDIEDCKRVVDKLEKMTNRRHYYTDMDVTIEKSVESVIKKIDACNGRLDILINNAGTAVFSNYLSRSKEEFMKVTEVNLYGPFLCIQKASGLMEKTDSVGSIVNIGSIYGMVSGDTRIYKDFNRNKTEVYAATKAGIIQMTKYFAVHLAEKKIRVNCISPGGVFNQQGSDFISNYSNKVPMKRMAEENEIAGGIVFLADNELSSYVNGQNIAIDGGWVAW
jgi:NAD(P)-dependent dehydrogenase (short-subunit alcohol dehydrogenase family)